MRHVVGAPGNPGAIAVHPGANTNCGGSTRTPSRKVVGCFPFFVVTSITEHVVSFSRAAHLGGGLLCWRIATGLRRDTRATDLVFWWRWLVSLPFFIFLTLSLHVSVCWCAVLGTPLLASPLPSGDLQCGEHGLKKKKNEMDLADALQFVDPRERAQSPVPLCAPPGFQAHGHACARALPGCVRAWRDGSLQTFTASCAEANCASMRACVRWRTPPVVRRQRRDQPFVLKTGHVVEATVPSFPQRSCQSLACAHGTDASVFRACARRTHIDRFSICFSGQSMPSRLATWVWHRTFKLVSVMG